MRHSIPLDPIVSLHRSWTMHLPLSPSTPSSPGRLSPVLGGQMVMPMVTMTKFDMSTGLFPDRADKGVACLKAVLHESSYLNMHHPHEGPATKSGLRNPRIKHTFIGLSRGTDQCGFN